MNPESSSFRGTSKVGSGDTSPPLVKRRKYQVNNKRYIPKWIPPEKRMRKYRKNAKDPWKIPFVKFLIVVPTDDDKKQLQAGFEFIHDGPMLNDNEFIVLNQIAHSYRDPEREKGCTSPIIVDDNLFRTIQQEICNHPKTWIDNGFELCKVCQKVINLPNISD